MGCCNEPVSTLTGTPPDPSQHVNYTRGMVLGVDDFTQEFAYLGGRDRWLARDVLGYGTLSGLQVIAEEDGADGWRVRVRAGSALVPSGQLVCVPADQCCVINRWLAKSENAAIVNRQLNPAVSPPLASPPVMSPPLVTSGGVELFLVLCYADCQTRPVPIPGEPCRSEDELMAPSRIADDFRLELRERAPVQTEEDAIRDFVRWLRANVTVGASPPGPPADEAAWLQSLRAAVQSWTAALNASPPVSPPITAQTLGDYLFDISPPIELQAPDLCAFLRVALRFWVTELRPMWMARRCHRAQFGDSDCVLLANIAFDVVWSGGSPAGTWQIGGSPVAVSVDESLRPVLGSVRLLQEWQLCGCECGAGGGAGGGAVAPVMGGAGMSPMMMALPPSAPSPAPMPMVLPLLFAEQDLQLDGTQAVVLARGQQALRITLPAAAPEQLGRVLTIKNIDVDDLSVLAKPRTRDRVEGAVKLAVKRGASVEVMSDGAGRWHVIGGSGGQ